MGAPNKPPAKKPSTSPANTSAAQQLHAEVLAAPDVYRSVRIYSVARTIVEGGKRPRLLRQGSLGEIGLEVFTNPGLEAFLQRTYGGEPAGTPYDCQLIKVAGAVGGPMKRVYVNTDLRPDDVKARVPAGMAPDSLVPMQVQGGMQGGQMMPAGQHSAMNPLMMTQAPWWVSMLVPVVTELMRPRESPLEKALLQKLLMDSESKGDKLADAIKTGMELGRDVASAQAGRTATGDIAEAVATSVTHIADAAIRYKTETSGIPNAGQKVRRRAETTAAPEVLDAEEQGPAPTVPAEAHFETLGWLIHSAITQGWPPGRALDVIEPYLPKPFNEYIENPLGLTAVLSSCSAAFPKLDELSEEQMVNFAQSLADLFDPVDDDEEE